MRGPAVFLPLALLSIACPRRADRSNAAAATPSASSASASVDASVEDVVDTSSIDAAPKHASGAYGMVVVSTTSAPPPLLVYLHGMGANPEDSCSYFERANATISGALVCPRGNMPASRGGAWGGMLPEKRKSLDDALVIARGLSPSGSVASSGNTLMGFSIGAAFAVELALAEPGRWSGLVLMSNPMEKLDPKRLMAAGIRRIVFATGEFDGSYPAMVALATSTTKAGLESRFVTLGKVGHRFAKDMPTRMVDVIEWVRSAPSR